VEPDSKLAAKKFVLPLQVLTMADVSRLNREIAAIQEFFSEAQIKGATTKSVPQTSQTLTAFCKANVLNLLNEQDRQNAALFFDMLRSKAPVVHASFATDPRPDFLMKLMTWFRREAHPYVLFKVGLQPSIGAGCMIRTDNKYYDFSFKEHFKKSKEKLPAALRAIA
jgi:F0F1-type ATP synthase delta subunit